MLVALHFTLGAAMDPWLISATTARKSSTVEREERSWDAETATDVTFPGAAIDPLVARRLRAETQLERSGLVIGLTFGRDAGKLLVSAASHPFQ
jgi:hypothetical protein